jgi:hypothetical protein
VGIAGIAGSLPQHPKTARVGDPIANTAQIETQRA